MLKKKKSDFVVENVPFLSTNSRITAPVVASDDFAKLVLFSMEQYDNAGLLTWHDESLPSNEILVKVGGDHGGDSFKMCFQVANLADPNSTKNTIPFVVSSAKDSPANLATALTPFANQITASSNADWKGKTISVTLFGD